MVIRFSRKGNVYPEFSNFWESPVTYNGITYRTSEGAFQAQKCLDRAEEFVDLTGWQAKKLGQQVSLRSDWERVKYDIMDEIVLAKFSKNTELAKLLVETGDAYIIENTSNWHDNSFGCCYCSRCMSKPAKNKLGFSLMKARNVLTNKTDTTFELSIKDTPYSVALSQLLQTTELASKAVAAITRYAR